MLVQGARAVTRVVTAGPVTPVVFIALKTVIMVYPVVLVVAPVAGVPPVAAVVDPDASFTRPVLAAAAVVERVPLIMDLLLVIYQG